MMPESFSMILLFACVACLVRGEVFTSMAHLEATLYAERDIAALIQRHVQQERERLNKLEKLAADYAEHSKRSLSNPSYYLGNPVNAFLLIKRLTLDWDRNVAPMLGNSTWQDFNTELEYARKGLPTFEDLTGAATALMRLQDTYHLDTSKIAHGDIAGVISTSLSADECFELGRLSYNDDDFYHTTLWMEESLSQLERGEESTDRRVELFDYLAFSYYKLFHTVECDVYQTAEDCFILGRLSYYEKDLYHTILWMQAALDIDKETYSTAQNHTIDRTEALDYLSYAMAVQGHVKHALTLTNELLQLDPNHQRASNNKRYFEDMLIQQGETPSGSADRPALQRQVDKYRQSSEFQTYEALCRGEVTQKIKDEHKLKCRYVHNNDPLLLIQPMKEEEMHLDPWIVVYHNAVSEKEMRDIKMLATPRLNRATVQNSVTGQLETATYRISKSAWLKGTDHPTIAKVNQKIQAVTGLEMETAEELQVANYGIGGQYEPHFDFARKEEKEAFKSLGTGNRIATFLAYMTDVEAGGATVFPYLGLKLYPKKGAAAFWYNLYRNGDGIYNTRHAACPVLVGVKWVSNKWIHERGQEFRRPCALSSDE